MAGWLSGVARPGFGMTAPLLRQANRFICSSCFHLRRSRFYASQALRSVVPDISAVNDREFHDPQKQPAPESSLGTSQTIFSTDSIAQKRQKAISSSYTTARKPRSSKEIKGSQRNPLDPNKVDLYLASIRAAGLEPTLEDIERCRPLKHAHPDSPQYPEDYNLLVDTLCRSFSKDQLRRFGELYGFDPIWTRSSRRKVEYAESIIEKQWMWPSLKEIERQRRDRTEVSVKSFNVNPSQLFLILGKDGVDLLQLSLEFNVHISLMANPLALRVEGLRGSLKGLTERIASLKKGIIEETFELPKKNPIQRDMVQRISRLAGAFVENVGYKGKVRICAKDARNLLNAKRLATRAAHETHDAVSDPLLSYLPTGVPSTAPVPTSIFPHTYALYPFLPPRSLPWTMNTGGAFRIRRVAEWLGVDPTEDISKTGGLAEGRGQLLTCSGENRGLRETLFHDLPLISQSTETSRVVTASLGHLLLTSSTPAPRADIVPPFKGYWPILKILKWLEKGETKNAFVPSLPVSILNSPPTNQRILHRLVYHSLTDSESDVKVQEASDTRHPTKVMKSEVVLAQPQPMAAKPSTTPPNEQKRGWSDDIDSLAFPQEHSSEYDLEDHEYDSEFGMDMPTGREYSDKTTLSSKTGESVKTAPPEMPSQCWVGTESSLNITMPDRSMDMHLSVFDSSSVAHDRQPIDLQAYISGLRSFLEYKDPTATQPEPPLSFSYAGDTYVLHTSATVRQGMESVPANPVDPSILDPTQHAIRVFSENILDLESNQKATECLVTCDNPASDTDWKAFLSQCDRLTATPRRPSLVSLRQT